MCSVCYRRHCLVNGGEPGGKAVAKASAATVAGALAAASVATASFAPSSEAKGAAQAAAIAATGVSSQPEAARKAPANHGGTCKKKVRLTGFACRCGATFYGMHGYPEEHACSFDFRDAGRDAISRAIPLIKGEKLAGRI